MSIINKVTGLLKKIGPLIPIAVEAAKSLAGSIAQIKPIDNSSSAEDVDNLVAEFDDFRTTVYQESSKLENGVQNAIGNYIEEYIIYLQNNGDVLSKYSIRVGKIEQRLREMEADIKNDLKEEVDKEITLNNRELQSVLCMIPGRRKQEAMSCFVENMFDRILDKYCVKINKRLSAISEEVEDKILGVVDRVVADTGQFYNKLELLKDDRDSNNAAEIAKEAVYSFVECDVVEHIFTEV